jgi:hypothetical protein
MDVDQSDDGAHSDELFIHELTVVNALLGRYVLRFLDADAGRTTAVTTADDRALAQRVNAVAEGIRARAERRDGAPTCVGPVDGEQV